MASRSTLAPDFRPDPAGEVLRRVEGDCRVGQFRVITPRMKQEFAAVVATVATRSVGDLTTIGEQEAASRGLEFGFYTDAQGQVRHVQDERNQIEADAATLRAADNGLVTLDGRRRAFMESRVELLERFDRVVSRRFNLPEPGPGY